MKSIRKNHKLRIKAFDELTRLKENNTSRKDIVYDLHEQSGVPLAALYGWYEGRHRPYGRRGKLSIKPELFYVIGALLGDGCLYKWKSTYNYIILVGDKSFATKYAKMLSECTQRISKAYIDRNKNIWFVKINNYELYSLFQKARENPDVIRKMMKKHGGNSSLLFIEGFFDAEGCVKIIKEKVRKTPKICLDITNLNYEILEVIKRLLKENLGIEARYSIQKAFVGKDGSKRKKIYHLRIYKKEFIRTFFNSIKTTKLTEEKKKYLKGWLDREKAIA